MSHIHRTLEERCVIDHLYLYGLSFREIGCRLGRHHTKISREGGRNYNLRSRLIRPETFCGILWFRRHAFAAGQA